jgi:hypothetical protein
MPHFKAIYWKLKIKKDEGFFNTNFLTHRHIGHIVSDFPLNEKELCVLCAYVLKKKCVALGGANVGFLSWKMKRSSKKRVLY